MVMGGLLGLAQTAESPLDDPDPAYQRPGILDLGDLPVPAPAVADGVPSLGRPAVVFFVRSADGARLCQALEDASFRTEADLAVVVAEASRVAEPVACDGAAVVADPDARLAHGYGLRRPRDGGAPEGYAVVDDTGEIRYRTLDAEVADLLDEVDTILRAT